MWDLPRPGLEPVSPALAGRFLTTAPPGKPPNIFDLLLVESTDVESTDIEPANSEGGLTCRITVAAFNAIVPLLFYLREITPNMKNTICKI